MKKEITWLLQEKYHGQPTKQFNKDVLRLQAGEPVDYVIGFTQFLGCTIDLSKKPLIPRPETEYWVEQAIQQIYHKSHRGEKGDRFILDMFSGSGCIGISIMRHIPNTQVTFSDADEKAIKQIKINLKNNSNLIRKNRSQVVRSNVFENIKGRFAYIFANPPYIPTVKKYKVGRSVLKYEPKKALFGGRDGLFFIKKFLKDAKSHLVEGGIIYIEFDPPQKKNIEKLLKQHSYSSWQFNKDQYGRWRWVEVKK